MGQANREDPAPAEDIQSAHTTEPAEGAREPGQGADEQQPPHPVEPAEGPREPAGNQSAGTAR